MANLIALRQNVQGLPVYEDPSDRTGPLHHDFQGHSRSSGNDTDRSGFMTAC